MSEPINPWVEKREEPGLPHWESIPVVGGPAVYRMRVASGWLYRLEKSKELCFVPEQ